MTAADLADRYAISAGSLRARLKFLGIDSNTITAADILKLDALAQHLDAGASIESFSYTPMADVQILEPELAIVRSTDSSELVEEPIPLGMELTLEDLEKVYAFLQRATDNEWHLPTSVIRSVTGATPKGKLWKRFGFEFIPATRHGAERAWAVQRASWDFPIA